MSNLEVLSKLPAKKPNEILRELVRSKEEHFLTVFPRNGATFSGMVVAIEENKGELNFVFQLLNDSGKSWSSDIVYISAGEISHIQVHNFLRHIKALSFGTVAYSPERKAPPRLELERQIGQAEFQIEEMLGRVVTIDVVWDSIQKTAASLINLQEILECYPKLIKKVSSDKLGKEALAPLKSFSFKHSSDETSLRIFREGTRLVLTTNFEAALPQDLVANIEKKINGAI